MASYYVGARETIDKGMPAIVNIWLLALALIVGFTAFIWSIFDIANADKGTRFKRIALCISIPFIGLASLIVSSSLFMGDAQLNTTAANASPTANAVYQDPEILSLLNSVGAKGDYSNLTMKWSSGDMASDCGWADSAGCYNGNSSSQTLILKKGDYSQEQLKTITAHEYLHYTWYKHSLDQDTRLTSLLIDLYAKNPAFQQRVSTHYVDSGGLKPSEFFSYGCTEIQDHRLGSYIASKCNEYIDTSTLSALY